MCGFAASEKTRSLKRRRLWASENAGISGRKPCSGTSGNRRVLAPVAETGGKDERRPSSVRVGCCGFPAYLGRTPICARPQGRTRRSRPTASRHEAGLRDRRHRRPPFSCTRPTPAQAKAAGQPGHGRHCAGRRDRPEHDERPQARDDHHPHSGPEVSLLTHRPIGTDRLGGAHPGVRSRAVHVNPLDGHRVSERHPGGRSMASGFRSRDSWHRVPPIHRWLRVHDQLARQGRPSPGQAGRPARSLAVTPLPFSFLPARLSYTFKSNRRSRGNL